MKICFKCAEIKPPDDFYKHPQMADGHLNKCKECTKLDSKTTHNRKRKDPCWVVSELKRHREKSAKYRAAGLASKPTKETREKWYFFNAHKKRAHTIVRRAIQSGKMHRQPCIVCGNAEVEAHHEDYSKPLDVMWLCRKHHGEHHHNKNIQRIIGQPQLCQ